jgi:hypothetical protein
MNIKVMVMTRNTNLIIVLCTIVFVIFLLIPTLQMLLPIRRSLLPNANAQFIYPNGTRGPVGPQGPVGHSGPRGEQGLKEFKEFKGIQVKGGSLELEGIKVQLVLEVKLDPQDR